MMKHNDTAYNIYVAFVIAQALTFPHIQPWLKIGLPKNHVMGMECACECVCLHTIGPFFNGSKS